MDTRSKLSEVRQARGISVSELAKLAGVKRQTIYAIEAGNYVPNTSVALHLARILEVRVEDLFSLELVESEPEPLSVDFITPANAGEPVQLCKVGNRTIGVAAAHHMILPPADAIALEHSKAEIFGGFEEQSKRLLIAGCDPGISILGDALDLVIAPSTSLQALDWLKQGNVHVAGTHLRDRSSGVYNLPIVKNLFAQGTFKVVTFAVWEQGLVTRRNSAIQSIEDLTRKQIRFINREKGAGSREVLDENLRAAGIPPKRINGYDRIASGHLPAAEAVARHDADCCIATRSAARAFGLHFIPLATERYDLVVRRQFAKLPAVEDLFDALNRSALRRKLAMLAGYDTAHTGEVLVA